MYILGIDTSCDDTSVALTKKHLIVTNLIASQITLHQPYGGVYPTVAKLAHQQNLAPLVTEVLKRSKIKPKQIKAVAVTQGPGLAPALEVGLAFAQKFAQKHRLPLIGINHLEAHAFSPLLAPLPRQKKPQKLPKLKFPLLALVISGGHSLMTQINDYGQYQILGETLDDAMGECLDKIGRLLNLGYPAGPVVEQLAQHGDPTRFRFPLPLTTHRDFNLSFSGLKTHAFHLIKQLEAEQRLDQTTLYDLCASTQAGVFRHLTYKLDKLLTQKNDFSAILLGGGVSANMTLRKELRSLTKKYQLPLYFPYTRKLCGDNGAMIALIGYFHFLYRDFSLSLDRLPNWPLLSWRQ